MPYKTCSMGLWRALPTTHVRRELQGSPYWKSLTREGCLTLIQGFSNSLEHRPSSVALPHGMNSLEKCVPWNALWETLPRGISADGRCPERCFYSPFCAWFCPPLNNLTQGPRKLGRGQSSVPKENPNPKLCFAFRRWNTGPLKTDRFFQLVRLTSPPPDVCSPTTYLRGPFNFLRAPSAECDSNKFTLYNDL